MSDLKVESVEAYILEEEFIVVKDLPEELVKEILDNHIVTKGYGKGAIIISVDRRDNNEG